MFHPWVHFKGLKKSLPERYQGQDCFNNAQLSTEYCIETFLWSRILFGAKYSITFLVWFVMVCFSFSEILNTIFYLCIQALGGHRSTEDRTNNLGLHHPHHHTTTTSTTSLMMVLAPRVIACCTLPRLHCVDTTGILATRQREEQKKNTI